MNISLRSNHNQRLSKLGTIVVAIVFWFVSALYSSALYSLPAYAQATLYPPPLSFSNAELSHQDFSGQVLRTAEFSNANMEWANFAQANLQGAVLSASVMVKANLRGANLSNALADMVNFTGADLRDALLTEAILLRSNFTDVTIAGADFTDAILDGVQIKALCKIATGTNAITGVSTYDSLGCP